MVSLRERQYRIAVKEAMEDLDEYIRNNKYTFTLDTNIIRVLAEYGEENLLLNVAHCDGYIFTTTNESEVYGQSHNEKLGRRTRQILTKFLKIARRKKTAPADSSVIEEELKSLLVLVPRKITYDIIIFLPDSFVNNLIRLYDELKNKMERRTAQLSDSVRATKYYNQAPSKFPNIVRERYESLCSELRIDRSKVDEKDYFRNVNRFIKEYMEEIENIKKRTRSLNEFLEEIRIVTQKEYTRDIKHLAETIAHGAVARSFDSDVIWLLRFRAARRVA